MTQFDPTEIQDGITAAIDSYQGPAPALLFEAYRDGLSISATKGTVGFDDSTLATTDDTFEIGSQTKMMTTTVLLQLVGEGRFSLDDRLADTMDVSAFSWMANIEDVTLRHLMTHKSGIPDFLNDVPEIFDAVLEMLIQDPPQPVGPDLYLELMEAFDPPALFEAGAASSYSNTGFMLLGFLIEAETGNTLAEEFQTRIFDPAGMTSSSLPTFGRPDGILRSYAEINGQLADVTDLPIYDLGDGGVVSTTGDMIRFMKALLIDGSLVPEDQMDALEEYFTTEGGPEDNEFIGHGGGTAGTGSITLFHPASGTIFSASETMRYGFDLPSYEVFDAFNSIFSNPAWDVNYTDADDLNFATTAAELEINEGLGAEGSAETHLTVDGVTLTFQSSLGDMETDSFTFEDGSVLFVADEAGSNFRVSKDARHASKSDTQLIGLSGDDRLVGGRGDDKISGGAGDDRLLGRRGNDEISGGAGDDRISGNPGDDTLAGGVGDDRMSGGRGDDWLDGGAGDDALRGGRGDDALSGGAGDDTLRGGRGHDDVSGGAGDDTLRGGRGDDILTGGEGDDLLIGGRGADTFVFAENSGTDTIRNFEVGRDQIDLTALTLSFDDLQVTEIHGTRSFEVLFEAASLILTTRNGDLSEADFLF